MHRWKSPLPCFRRTVLARTALVARALAVPLVVWSAWFLASAALYGTPHLAGGLALVGARRFDASHFANHALTLPLYYGAALGFPMLAAP